MKEYELTVLVHPDLEVDLDTPLVKIRKLITSNGGEITKEDIWGKKRLSYRIKKEDFAVYVFFELKLPAQAPLKISNTLNISNEVLRYLLVTTDERARKAIQNSKNIEEQNENNEQDINEEE